MSRWPARTAVRHTGGRWNSGRSLAGPASPVTRRTGRQAAESRATVGPWLTTASVVHGCWEVRLVRVAADAPAGPWTLRIGGWPVAADEAPDGQEGPGTALARAADGLASCVIALHGTLTAGVHRPAVPHAFGRHAAVPFLRSAGPVLPGETYAAAVALSGDPAGPGEPPRLAIGRGEASDLAVVIRWSDGEQDRLTL